jgi:hypothetical protein
MSKGTLISVDDGGAVVIHRDGTSFVPEKVFFKKTSATSFRLEVTDREGNSTVIDNYGHNNFAAGTPAHVRTRKVLERLGIPTDPVPKGEGDEQDSAAAFRTDDVAVDPKVAADVNVFLGR